MDILNLLALLSDAPDKAQQKDFARHIILANEKPEAFRLVSHCCVINGVQKTPNGMEAKRMMGMDVLCSIVRLTPSQTNGVTFTDIE